MADNAQKTPIPSYLDQKVRTKVSALLQVRSGRLPATLHKADGGSNTVWWVNFETDGTYTLPMVKMPVHTNEYTRPPYKEGDKGFVSTADVDTTSMSGLNDNSTPASFARPANLAALVWHPLGSKTFNDVIDATAHERYGGPGGDITHDGEKKSLVKLHKLDGASISADADGTGAPGPHEHKADSTGTTSKSTVAHQIQAPNAQLDNSGNLHNTGTTTSNGAISSATSMSAPSGNFAGGSMGGLSLAGGLLSGGGSSGSPAVSIDANAGAVSANVVAAKKYALLPSYTVAQLFAALPPTTTPAGARVFVTDFSGSATYGATISSTSGGGSTATPAYCTGTVWGVG